MRIQAVIWDMGGVLLRTEDQSHRHRLAEQLQVPDGRIEQLVFESESSRKAQLGEIGVEEHWEYVRMELGISIDEMPAVRRGFWAGDAVDTGLVEDIRSLRAASYMTGLLSNAFSETRRFITEECRIDDAFNQIVISAEEGIMKPDRRIYQIMLERLGVPASQAVFIDDVLENVTGARQAGLYAIQFKDSTQVRADLRSLLDGNLL